MSDIGKIQNKEFICDYCKEKVWHDDLTYIVNDVYDGGTFFFCSGDCLIHFYGAVWKGECDEYKNATERVGVLSFFGKEALKNHENTSSRNIERSNSRISNNRDLEDLFE